MHGRDASVAPELASQPYSGAGVRARGRATAGVGRAQSTTGQSPAATTGGSSLGVNRAITVIGDRGRARGVAPAAGDWASAEREARVQVGAWPGHRGAGHKGAGRW